MRTKLWLLFQPVVREGPTVRIRLPPARDRWFESIFLQRRVCEPSVPKRRGSRTVTPGMPAKKFLEFGDALLGRNGEIAAAAAAIYRRVLARDPEFGDQMIDAGRDREVGAAYRETG